MTARLANEKGRPMAWIQATWAEAVKAFLISLPYIGWLAKRFLERKDSKEVEREDAAANRAAADLDPDRVGPRLRGGLRRRGR